MFKLATKHLRAIFSDTNNKDFAMSFLTTRQPHTKKTMKNGSCSKFCSPQCCDYCHHLGRKNDIMLETGVCFPRQNET